MLVETEVFAKDIKIKYKRENISNYFLRNCVSQQGL